MAQEILSNEQKKTILEYWDKQVCEGKPPRIMDIVTHIFGDGVDGRSKEGKAVKEFLASLQITPQTSEVYEKKVYTLTEAELEYVRNNRALMNSLEMAKVLFSDRTITNTSVELRALDEYNQSLGPSPRKQAATAHEEWSAPRRESEVIARVNVYFQRGGGIDVGKVTSMQKKEMASLLRYLNIYRFKTQINVYDDIEDRELFESTFIRYTYDKGDLLEEEVDQYIILAQEAVLQKHIQRRSERLQRIMDEQTGTTGDSGENARVSMSLAEMIGKITTEYNACVKRQTDLVHSLKEKRSARLSRQVKENASILNLIEYWKSHKTRQEFLELAEKRKTKVKEEIDRLSSMEDVMCRVIGISQDEALNG